jgi:hypothetical protein
MNALISCASLCRGLAAAVAVGVAVASTNAHAMNDLRVRVINHTGQSILAVHVSHHLDGWIGPNRQNVDELPPEWSELIDADDGVPGCLYDFLAVMEDHMTMQKVDACRVSRVVFRE